MGKWACARWEWDEGMMRISEGDRAKTKTFHVDRVRYDGMNIDFSSFIFPPNASCSPMPHAPCTSSALHFIALQSCIGARSIASRNIDSSCDSSHPRRDRYSKPLYRKNQSPTRFPTARANVLKPQRKTMSSLIEKTLFAHAPKRTRKSRS